MPEDADQWELLDLQNPTSARLLNSFRALWEQHRNEILAAWVKEKPGTRPARWWEFDAPRSDIGTYSGENQAAFLDRHDLLTPSEKRAMVLESYEPQAMVFEPGD